MNDEIDNIPQDFEPKFAKVVSVAGEIIENDFVRPSDEAIDSYLFGNPADEEARLVQIAMMSSSAFRRELVTMLRDQERLKSLVDGASAAVVEVPPMPVSLVGKLEGTNTGNATKGQSPWTTMKIVASLAVAAAVIIVSVKYYSKVELPSVSSPPHSDTAQLVTVAHEPEVLTLNRVAAALPPEELVVSQSRAVGHSGMDTAANYESPGAAAIAGLQEILEFDGDYVLQPKPGTVITPQSNLPDTAAYLALGIQFSKSAADWLSVARSRLSSAALDSLQLWVLDLPNRDLSNCSVSTNMALFSPPSGQKSISIVLIWRQASVFKPLPVGTVILPK